MSPPASSTRMTDFAFVSRYLKFLRDRRSLSKERFSIATNEAISAGVAARIIGICHSTGCTGLLRFHLFPKLIQLRRACIGRPAALLGKQRLHAAETPLEFGIRLPEARLGIDVEATGKVDACEEQIAHLIRQPLPVGSVQLGAQLADLLMHLVQDAGHIGPVE